jgi:hypothetical protein
MDKPQKHVKWNKWETKDYTVWFYWYDEESKFIETVSRLVIAEAGESGEWLQIGMRFLWGW